MIRWSRLRIQLSDSPTWLTEASLSPGEQKAHTEGDTVMKVDATRVTRWLTILILAVAVVPFLADLQFSLGHGKVGIAYAKDSGGGNDGSGGSGGGHDGGGHDGGRDLAMAAMMVVVVRTAVLREGMRAVGLISTPAPLTVAFAVPEKALPLESGPCRQDWKPGESPSPPAHLSHSRGSSEWSRRCPADPWSASSGRSA